MYANVFTTYAYFSVIHYGSCLRSVDVHTYYIHIYKQHHEYEYISTLSQ